MNIKNLKQFNLKAALNGEPVMLRNGSKAFVRHHETEEAILSTCHIWGVVLSDDADEHAIVRHWTQQGRYISNKVADNQDIIGMWPKTHMVNGFEVPAPETEEPEYNTNYYMPSLAGKNFYSDEFWDDHGMDRNWLKRGLVFLTEEDAIANAKAMLGINPYEDEE